MDWPFETYVMHPAPKKIEGIAEIAGKPSGFWEIRNVWVKTGEKSYRTADYDERKQITLSLEMMAGGQIGRAYRNSLVEPRYEHC